MSGGRLRRRQQWSRSSAPGAAARRDVAPSVVWLGTTRYAVPADCLARTVLQQSYSMGRGSRMAQTQGPRTSESSPRSVVWQVCFRDIDLQSRGVRLAQRDLHCVRLKAVTAARASHLVLRQGELNELLVEHCLRGEVRRCVAHQRQGGELRTAGTARRSAAAATARRPGLDWKHKCHLVCLSEIGM